MPRMLHLSVTSEILAVATQPANHSFVTIPAGAMIDTSDDVAEPGMRRVTFNGKDLLAFTIDIRERTEKVKTATAG